MTVKTNFAVHNSRKNRCTNAEEIWISNDVFSVVQYVEKENCPKRSAETFLIPTFMLTRTFFARAPVFPVSCSFRGSVLCFEETTDNNGYGRDKTVRHESGIIAFESVVIYHSFLFILFLFPYNFWF